MIYALIALIVCGVCAAAVIVMCHRAPLIEELDDEEDRLTRIFLRAVHHRDQLDACFDEVCEIHKFAKDSVGYDEMIDVVYSGNSSYQEAMERIARLTNDRD